MLDFILATLFILTLIKMLNEILIWKPVEKQMVEFVKAFVTNKNWKSISLRMIIVSGLLTASTSAVSGFLLYISHEAFLRVINLFF